MEAKQMIAPYEVFNIGTGNGHSVLELINTFEKVTGKQLNYRIGPPRNGDIVRIWGDVSLAETELNWKAENGLTCMLASAWAWENYISNNPF